MQTVTVHQRVSSEEETTIEQGGRLGRMDKGESERKEGGLHVTMTGKPEGSEGGTWENYGESVPEGSWWTDRRPGSCAPGTEMEGDILGIQDIFKNSASVE